MQTVTLNNGVEVPILGFGVYQIPADQTEQVVAQALADRVPAHRHRRLLPERRSGWPRPGSSGIPRDELFVTTKLWMEHAGYDATRPRSNDRWTGSVWTTSTST